MDKIKLKEVLKYLITRISFISENHLWTQSALDQVNEAFAESVALPEQKHQHCWIKYATSKHQLEEQCCECEYKEPNKKALEPTEGQFSFQYQKGRNDEWELWAGLGHDERIRAEFKRETLRIIDQEDPNIKMKRNTNPEYWGNRLRKRIENI